MFVALMRRARGGHFETFDKVAGIPDNRTGPISLWGEGVTADR